VTEQEWDGCTDLEAMLEFLRASSPGCTRKWRLFFCAGARRAWPLLARPGYREAVDLAERYADGQVEPEELTRAHETLRDAHYEPFTRGVGPPQGSELALNVARQHVAVRALHDDARLWVGRGAQQGMVWTAYPEEARADCGLLRDIFGPPPFRPVTLDPAWLAWHGGAVRKLAGAVYDDRDLPSGHLDAARLAVLADMLEEAGCTDADLLGHLRLAGPHVRGCFAIDPLLRRS
jgi:hypothetical protein